MTLATKSYLLIYFDLELCDGSFTSEIYQIGGKTSHSEFSTFILPNGTIDWGVTKYAGGIKIITDDTGKRELVKDSTIIKSVSEANGIRSFIEWMQRLKEEGQFEKVVLIAHGNTDMPALLNKIASANFTAQIKTVVDFFVNSLKYFESKFPDWEKYNISAMYIKLFNQEKTDVHNALEDAKALYEIMEEINKDDKDSFIKTVLKQSVCVEDGYTISARKVITSLRKRKIKPHMSTNVKRFCAFPDELLEKVEKDIEPKSVEKHPISALIEHCAKLRWKAPSFSIAFASGPVHKKQFIFKVVVNEQTFQPESPTINKKKAKSDAASLALKNLVSSDSGLNNLTQLEADIDCNKLILNKLSP
jgi:hypothetical protein